jgi:hypothetical protein
LERLLESGADLRQSPAGGAGDLMRLAAHADWRSANQRGFFYAGENS